MKFRFLFILLSSLVFFSCLSSSQDSSKLLSNNSSRPQWVTDEGRQIQFPQTRYVSAFAWGRSTDEAKSNSAAELSNYVQSSINAQTNASFEAMQIESSAASSEYKKLRANKTDTKITSQNTLYQIQYTTPWHDKSQDIYYCCAYINRSEAWSYIEPKMQKVRQNFTKQYNEAFKQEDNFSKINAIKRAQNLLSDFYQYYDFAIFIDANKATAYKELDNLAVTSYETLALLQQETRISINVVNDYNKRIQIKLASLFENAGFIVTKNSDSDYFANAEVIYVIDLMGDVYTAYPEFNLNLTYQEKPVASYNKHIAKVATYEEKNTMLRIFSNLEKELEKTFIKECLNQ